MAWGLLHAIPLFVVKVCLLKRKLGNRMMPYRLEGHHDFLWKISDGAGVVVATGLATYGSWREGLHEWNAVAADLAPIVGIAWIVIQAGVVLFRLVRGKSRVKLPGHEGERE